MRIGDLTISPLDRAAALAVAAWRYPPPYDRYDFSADPIELALFLQAIGQGYYQLRDQGGGLVAFCCYGAEGQVPGGDYDAPALDIGIGVRPDLTGQGQGMRYLGAVLGFGAAEFAPPAFRLTVASFNTRAMRLYSRAGFQPVSHFQSLFAGISFMIMRRDS